MRTSIALIGKKLGSSAVFSASTGVMSEITIIDIGTNAVIDVKTNLKHGYEALVLAGGGVAKESRLSRSVAGVFKKSGVNFMKNIKEFRLPVYFNATDFAVGSKFEVNKALVGSFVDVSGVSIGKGFAGGMKRWNFSGQRATHGNSLSHRVHGSTGCRTEPGEVVKGKKMAGHLGNECVTVQNLRVLEVDVENGHLIVAGSVPGFVGRTIYIKNSVKKLGVQSVLFNGVKPSDLSSTAIASSDSAIGVADVDTGFVPVVENSTSN